MAVPCLRLWCIECPQVDDLVSIGVKRGPAVKLCAHVRSLLPQSATAPASAAPASSGGTPGESATGLAAAPATPLAAAPALGDAGAAASPTSLAGAPAQPPALEHSPQLVDAAALSLEPPPGDDPSGPAVSPGGAPGAAAAPAAVTPVAEAARPPSPSTSAHPVMYMEDEAPCHCGDKCIKTQKTGLKKPRVDFLGTRRLVCHLYSRTARSGAIAGLGLCRYCACLCGACAGRVTWAEPRGTPRCAPSPVNVRPLVPVPHMPRTGTHSDRTGSARQERNPRAVLERPGP